MAVTPSTMLPLGTEAPDFALPDTTGRVVTRDSVRGPKGLLVMFICNHCPFVKHVRSELARLGRELPSQGIHVVAINANDAEAYPEDSPAQMAAEAIDAGYVFPYLYDETQSVAKAYRAACTPDVFLFDGELRLVYRGQLDGSRPGNDIPLTGGDIRAATAALVSGERPLPDQKPSMGCNIKWKAGNAPSYAG